MDESSASSSSVRKHFEKNKGAGTVTCKFCQSRLKWNRSTTSSFGTTSKGNTSLRLQVKLCCQNGAPIYSCLHILFFSTLVGKSLMIIMIYSCSHYSRIFDYSCCRKRTWVFDSHKMSIRFTPSRICSTPCAGRRHEYESCPWEHDSPQQISHSIIEKVESSPWTSPTVPARKPNGSVRICGDYSKTINANADWERYPLPTIEEIRTKLSGGQKFSTLDLSQAYHQLELGESSGVYTTITRTGGCTNTNASRSEYILQCQSSKGQSKIYWVISKVVWSTCIKSHKLGSAVQFGTTFIVAIVAAPIQKQCAE